MFGWFGTVIREEREGLVQRTDGSVVPVGDELVHLFRGDVLRGLFRRAVLCTQLFGALAGRRIQPWTADTRDALAQIRSGLAHQRSGDIGGFFAPMHRLGVAGHQHADPAQQRRDHHAGRIGG
jgi:hypothetical protein